MDIGNRVRAGKSVERTRALGRRLRDAPVATELMQGPAPAAPERSCSLEPPTPPALQRGSAAPAANPLLLSRVTPAELLTLQRSIGNRAVTRQLARLKAPPSPPPEPSLHPGKAASPRAGESSTRPVPTSARFGRADNAVQRDVARARSQAAFGKASLADSGPVVQRANGRASGVRRYVTFDKREIPADGAATSQARARGFGAATVEWETVGEAFGSKIEKASGLITAGSNLPSRAKRLTVRARSTKDGRATARGSITLWEEKLFQAKEDYKQFIKGSPYEVRNFTTGVQGKFDVKYFAASRRLGVYVRVKYDFPADPPVPGETPRQARARERRWARLANRFKSIVTKQWSGRYTFKNIREPQEVWRKLNPVTVKVNIENVELNKKVVAAPHWKVEFDPANYNAANVSAGTAHLPTSLAPEKWFNPAAKEGELIRLNRLIPTIKFAKGSNVVPPADVDQLRFLATYLKRIRVPRYSLAIEGSATDETVPWKVRRRANERAAQVRRVLRQSGLTYHTVRLGRKANDTYVTITPKVSDKFVNEYDIISHEFGHMLGLGDEYPHTVYSQDAKGNYLKEKDPFTNKMVWKKEWATKATHYGLVEKALGTQYAEKTAKLFVPPDSPYKTNRVEGSEEFSTSLMGSGKDVRIQHYVTFWAALAQATGGAAVPKTKFGQADWKFVGG